MPWEAACIFNTGEAMEPQLINNFAAVAFCVFKDFGTSSEDDCNMEVIRTTLAIENASDQAAV